MAIPRFLQIHTLHSYPAALLNRDDSGLAKRMPFGGSTRTRISSQCLKRHWRMAEDQFAIHNVAGSEAAIRSRNIIERKVMQPLRDPGDFAEDLLKAVEDSLNVGVYGSSGTAKSSRQPLLLGLPEVEYLQEKARQICEANSQDVDAAKAAADLLFNARQGEGANFRAFRESARLPGGLEGALFGRMVTSDPGANIEAAIHVAHAFTVHREESESDYFSVVDDLQGDDEDAGAAHIGDMELTAGLFYGYVVIDVPGLVSNLEGCTAEEWEGADRELAANVVKHLTHLIATVSPGAKRGSTAPYSRADLMLIEAGNTQPRSLANAYRHHCQAQVETAMNAMSLHLGQLDAAYGAKEARRLMSVEDCELPGATRLNLDHLAQWAASAVRSGSAE